MAMSDTEFRMQLARLHLSQAEFARLAGVETSTASRYANGKLDVPRSIAALLTIMDREDVELLELLQ